MNGTRDREAAAEHPTAADRWISLDTAVAAALAAWHVAQDNPGDLTAAGILAGAMADLEAAR